MDCNMPVMDGYEATAKIKQLYSEDKISWSDPPSIVALTAYSSEVNKNKCLSAGMKSFLSKPANSEELRQILKETMLIEASEWIF